MGYGGLPKVSSDVTFLEFHSAVPVQAGNSCLRKWQQRYVCWLRITDAVVITVAVVAALLLRFGAGDNESLTSYVLVPALIATGWLACLAIFRTRAPSVIGVGTEEYRRVWTATLATFGAVTIVTSLVKFDIARGYLAIALPLGVGLLTLSRHLARRHIGKKRLAGQFNNRVLAVGNAPAVQSFERCLSRQPDYGYTVVDSRSPDDVRHDLGYTRALAGDGPVEDSQSAMARAVAACSADTVALVSGDLTPDEIRDLSWELERLDVDLVVSLGMADVSGPRLTSGPPVGFPSSMWTSRSTTAPTVPEAGIRHVPVRPRHGCHLTCPDRRCDRNQTGEPRPGLLPRRANRVGRQTI